MSKLTSLPERALELASAVGDNLKNAVPAVGQHAGKWLETGAKLGALKGGVRVAGTFVRRNPVLVAAAVAGAGLLWYAARRRARQAENGSAEGQAIEGRAKRVDARRGTGRAPVRQRTVAARDTGTSTGAE
ncbi:hypothetical protein ACFOLC_14905 [Lysobacter cavernae]|uniref:DUF3618 domain-containing protein n=1 Tax=Lysobacter cavernae TaxID=1685901 RepID=A0ABV7RUD5_9GAMM